MDRPELKFIALLILVLRLLFCYLSSLVSPGVQSVPAQEYIPFLSTKNDKFFRTQLGQHEVLSKE